MGHPNILTRLRGIGLIPRRAFWLKNPGGNLEPPQVGSLNPCNYGGTPKMDETSWKILPKWIKMDDSGGSPILGNFPIEVVQPFSQALGKL